MEQQLFRKKSIDRITSPEELHDYMRVTSPRLWMLLAAILVLVVGFIVYASVASMENAMDVKVIVQSGQFENEEGVEETVTAIYTTIPGNDSSIATPGMKVRIGDIVGTVNLVYTDDTGVNVLIDVPEGTMLPDGEYDGQLVLETTSPISFLLN